MPASFQISRAARLRCAGGLLAAVAALALSACGGGGGSSHVASIPPPPAPTPTPTSSAVDIFSSPASQEFAAIGIGSDLHIRYVASSNKYEVLVGGSWVQLVDDPLSSPLPGRPNQMFVFAGAPTNQSFFILDTHYSFGDYQYSNIAHWADAPAGVGGLTAFGIPTPLGGVPVTGSASYQGLIDGFSTIPVSYGEWGTAAADIGGTVNLNFNFGSGTLDGDIHPYLNAITRYDLGTLAFKDTVFGIGSTTFSGAFATSLSGPNSFSGQFTGPNAQELIGKWAFPFISPIDGSPASASGALIAKKN